MMNAEPPEEDGPARLAETVRQVVAARERAPRSPRMERALKRLIWRYSHALQDMRREKEKDAQE